MAKSYETSVSRYFDAVLVDASAAKVPQRCSARRVVEISKEQFEEFRKNPDRAYSFIGENTGYSRLGSYGEVDCLLVMPEGGRDGMLVLTNGSNRADKVAHLPFARDILRQEQYFTLSEYNRKMAALVDRYATSAVENQVDGQVIINVPQLKKDVEHSDFDENMFLEMLSERPEIGMAEWTEDAIYVAVAEEYLRMEDDSNLVPVSQQEFEIMCAKHKLWLLDSGGEQADFSGRLLRELDMTRLSLDNAIFKGAKLSGCDMTYTSLKGANFDEARIYNCKCTWMVASDATFRETKFKGSDLAMATLRRTNLYSAQIRDCFVDDLDLADSCVDRTDFCMVPMREIKMHDCCYDEQQWVNTGVTMEMVLWCPD